jgi:hypothetical protein
MLCATLSRIGRSAGLCSPFDALMYRTTSCGRTRERENRMSKLSWRLLTKKPEADKKDTTPENEKE